ncbi:hypothetical protein DV738_g1964, partial [Chaetothyriales sp. CBS 135597]
MRPFDTDRTPIDAPAKHDLSTCHPSKRNLLPVTHHHLANDRDMSSAGCHGVDPARDNMHCCCGRLDCAYLEYNTNLISDLERDLNKAAKLGQALLSRHECFVAKAREENDRLSATIAELQAKREELQTANERIVAENRELVEQLDAINASYKSSDEAAKNLEQQLRCVELEIGQLAIRARRAEELEACVQDLHLERTTLEGKLHEAEVESRTMLARWRQSERKIKQLESELDKIEWESKLQREKHDDAVARLEHERVVDRELSGAEARLKGAAAVHEIDGGATNTSVVSSFVRDILQDNATLQAGILELRELLQSSNDEVQNLRQQVMSHQPLGDTHSVDQLPDCLSLDQQRGWHQPTPEAAVPPQAEFHVHHHYHAKIPSKRDRTSAYGRTPRRRSTLRSVVTPRTSLPSTPYMAPLQLVSSPDLPLRRAQARRNRSSAYFSVAGESTISSMPSTPRSAFDRYSSIFDRIDPSEESSRPTSPESTAGFLPSCPDSETWVGMKKRRPDYFDAVAESEDRAEVAQVPAEEDREAESLSVELSKLQTQALDEESANMSPTWSSHSRHLDEMETNVRGEGESEVATTCVSKPPGAGSAFEEEDFKSQLPLRPPLLHHSGSHDSLVSISGMDIHIAKRPTASLLKGANSAYFPILPSSVRCISASQPVAGITDITATSSQQTFTSLAQGPAGLHLQSIARVASTKEPVAQTKGFGRLGGWVLSRWGAGPAAEEREPGLRSSSSPVVAQTGATQISPGPGSTGSLANAQWLVPDSSQPDLATTWNDGDSVTLSWAALNSSICDLWLTGPASDDDYAIRLASNINLAQDGTLPWSIDIGSEKLNIGQVFTLAFIPTGQAFSSSQQVHITSVRVGAGIAVVIVLTLIIGLLFWVFHLRRRVRAAQARQDHQDRKGILRSTSPSDDFDLELPSPPSLSATSSSAPSPLSPPAPVQLRRQTLPGLHEMKADTRQPQELSTDERQQTAVAAQGGGRIARQLRGSVYEMPA